LKTELPPVALTIAGSDPSGGAGLQMDLKVFCALGVYGAAVLTAVTAQNSMGVRRVRGLPAHLVEEQLAAVFQDMAPAAIKTGMLWSAENVRVVARQLRQWPALSDSSRAFTPSEAEEKPREAEGRKIPPLVIDPVIWAGDGTRLLSESGVKALVKELLPLTAIITPNLAEASRICGEKIGNTQEAKAAAEKILKMGASAVLVKGGHLKGEPVDILFDGTKFTEFRAQRRTLNAIHGTGCALSAAITAFLARGCGLAEAVSLAHEYSQRLIQGGRTMGEGSRVLFPESTP